MSKAKKKKPQEQFIEPANHNNWWRIALIVLLGLLLFYPPYVQGLFFKQHMFATHIITGILFILVWINKYRQQDFSFISSPLDWAVLGYAAAYALSLTTAVVIGEAVYGFLRALNYFMIYWIITQVVKDHADIRTVLRILLVSGLGVAVIGILAITGLIDYPKAFFDGHIASTMGYHNTMATFLVISSLLGFSFLMVEKNHWWQLFYCITNYLMMLVIMAAVSKGAWIVFALGLLLLITGMPKGYRIKAIYFLIITIGCAIIVGNYFTQTLASENQTAGIWFILAGALPVLGGWILWRYIEPRRKSLKLSRPVITILISAALIACIFTISQIGLSDKISTEVSEITDTENLSYVTRVDFMRWGTAIIKDYPITGAGAGGWEALYRQYQEYKFWTTRTHSHIFQVGVEAGTIGILAFVSMWAIFFFLLYKLYIFHRGRKEQEEWALIWGTAVAAMTLGLHSCFDFDLSLPAMAILLWSLLALLSVCYQKSGPGTRACIDKPWINVSISVVLVVTLLLSGGKYLLAYQQVQAGIEKMLAAQANKNNVQLEPLNMAGSYFARALKNDPLNAEYWSCMAIQQGTLYQVFNGQDNNKVLVFREQSIRAAGSALDRDPFDIDINQQLLPYLVIMGDTEGIIKAGQYCIRTLPNDPRAYQKIAELWWDVSQKCEANGQHELALEFAEEIIILKDQLQRQMSRVQIDHPLWQGEKLTVLPKVKDTCQQAQAFIAADKKP